MQKEIHEQPEALLQSMRGRVKSHRPTEVRFAGLFMSGCASAVSCGALLQSRRGRVKRQQPTEVRCAGIVTSLCAGLFVLCSCNIMVQHCCRA
jgi:hypothetical protein